MDSKTYLNLKFSNRSQEFLFKEFLMKMRYFKPALQFVFEDNMALFNLPGYPAWLAVFPYEDEGLHFEISRNLNGKINLSEAIPIHVNDFSDLEAVIPALRVLFVCSPSLDKAKKAEPAGLKEKVPGQVSGGPERAVKAGKPAVSSRIIEKFFG